MQSTIDRSGTGRQCDATGVCDHVHGPDDPLAGRHRRYSDHPHGWLHRIDAGTLLLSVLDVGQGDSILIQSPGGKTMLVDAGESDAGGRVAAPLSARGISSLDAAAISHAFADHIRE